MMRRSIGVFLLGIGTLLKAVFVIILFASAATGIWWPLTKVIIDNPVSGLWWVPVGFFLTGLSFAVAQLIYDLVIGIPLSLLTTWLLKDVA